MIVRNPGRDIATAVIEPNALYREGLASILTAAGFNIVISSPTVDNDILTSLNAHDRKLIILGSDGEPAKTISQIRRLNAENGGATKKRAHIAVLGNHLDAQAMLSLIQAGARACLTRDTTSESLVSSLELIMSGVLVVPPEVLASLLSSRDTLEERAEEEVAPHYCAVSQEPTPVARQELAAHCDDQTPHLSAQEKRILRHLVEGASNKSIARKVDIAEATVKVHVKAILRKVRLQNRTQAAVWALNNPSVFVHAPDGVVDRPV